MSKDFYSDFWGKAEKESNIKGSKFRVEPVSPEVFFKDWLKTPLFPRQLKAVNASFKSDFKDISTAKNEFILAQGKRSGKDLSIANLLTYFVYWLLCLQDSQEYLGIKSGEPIDIVNVAFDREQAQSVFFEKFSRKVREALNPFTNTNPFEDFGMNIDSSILNNQIIFPKNIRAWSLNSRSYKSEGKNIVIGVFDEIAQFRFDKAMEIRKHIRTTARMTALKFYKLFYISFLTSGNDYMAYLLDKASEEKDSHYYVDRAATWDVRSAKGCLPELKKYVVKKEDYQEDYDEDPIDSMLMYECLVPKFHANNLIKRPEKILKCINLDRPDPRIDTEKLWVTNLMDVEWQPWFRPYYTWEIWNLEKQYEKTMSEELANRIKLEKEKHQHAEHFVHLDLSRGVVDCAGLALGHTYRILDKVKVYIDLVIQIRADKESESKEIDLESILKFVLWLHKDKKFTITKLSADGWNSALLLEICKKNHIEAELLSLDRTMIPYETLKDLIYREDIDLYNYPVAIRELRELIITDKKKVDHPNKSHQRMREEGLSRGSSDTSDCIAGITYNMVKDEDSSPLSYFGK